VAKTPRHATDSELAVLKQLWASGAMTARSIAELLYPAASPSDLGTVQKLLSRLEEKGLVERERRPPAHLFRATASMEEFVGEQLEAMAAKLSDGSLAPFVTHLVNARGLTKRERHEIRKLLGEQ
jgi:predicted transcriptional regulator